nr:hypothetical protein GCM10020093_009690 [Planobispora longispora]
MGDSYYGYTTIAAAIGGHPALKAIAPRVTGSQLSMVLEYGDGTRDVEQTARKFYFASHYVDADRYEWAPDWSGRPLRATFERFFEQIGKRSANFDAEFTGGSRFVPPPVKALVESRPVPALYTIGWFDNCAIWSWHDVRALARDPEWAERLYLRLEAIDHENYWLGHAPSPRATTTAPTPPPSTGCCPGTSTPRSSSSTPSSAAPATWRRCPACATRSATESGTRATPGRPGRRPTSSTTCPRASPRA